MCKEMCRDICQTLSKLVGYVLILVTFIFMIFGIAGSALAGAYLFSDIDLDIGALNLPDFIIPFVFGFSLFLLVINLCGCIGFSMAMRKADQKLNGIMEDGDNESSGCRCGMKIWMGCMVLFGLLHIILGIVSMVYGDQLDLSDLTTDANGRVTDGASDLSCEVESQIGSLYGPTFQSDDWKDLQQYFGCCGYSMYDQRTWTGDCCPDWNTTDSTTESTTGSTAEPQANTTATDDNVATADQCDITGSIPYDGDEDMETVMGECDNKSTCSARWSELFTSMGLYMLILGCFEWACVVLGCCLARCSYTAKDDRPQP